LQELYQIEENTTMDEKKEVSSRGDVESDRAAESDAVSRRAFMRKSAEVAALSLFGVIGLDAVVDRVLERVAENQAMGRLSDAAAGALKRHKLAYLASAGTCGNKVGCKGQEGHNCHNYFNAHCDPTHPFGCTEQLIFGCDGLIGFVCGTRVTCPDDNAFFCQQGFNPRHCRDAGHFVCPDYTMT